MPNITLSIPDDIKKKMKDFPRINWSFIVKRAIALEIERQKMKKIFLEELEKEKEDMEWAVKVVRKGRKDETGSRH